jgi:transcription initiation factor IIF auxiliary subunit
MQDIEPESLTTDQIMRKAKQKKASNPLREKSELAKISESNNEDAFPSYVRQTKSDQQTNVKIQQEESKVEVDGSSSDDGHYSEEIDRGSETTD